MLAKKPPAQPVPDPDAKKQLEILYARRMAVDSLIQSLVDYDRLRAKRLEILKEDAAWQLHRGSTA